MIERGQFLGARQRGIENRGDQAIDRLGVGDALQTVVDDADLHAAGLVSSILVGGIDVAQIRSVRQPLLAGQIRVSLDPPEKVGAGGPSQIPHLVAEEISIRQAQHARDQGRQDLLGQRDFADRVGRHLRSEQDMRPVLHQADEADLGIGALALAHARPAEGGVELGLVGRLERAAVETDQSPTLEPGAPGRRRRDGLDRFIVQAPRHFGAQPRARLRNAGFSGRLDRGHGILQPPKAFQQAAQHLSARVIHIERQRDDVINHDMRGQLAVTNARLAGLRQDFMNLGDRERLGDDAKADEIRNPPPYGKPNRSARHRCRP